MASKGLALDCTEPAHAAMDIVVTVAKYIGVAPPAIISMLPLTSIGAIPPPPAIAPAAAWSIAMHIMLAGMQTATALVENG